MPGKSVESEKALLIKILDQAFNKSAWHGTNLFGSVSRLSSAQAVWRPTPKNHNIWEIVLHTAYWKYAVRRRLTEQKRGSFPRRPSDWPKLPESLSVGSWKKDRDLLMQQHNLLRQAVLDCPSSRLNAVSRTSKWTLAQVIYGVASHDLYHAGQIQLLKRLQKTMK
jgi:uncharacterized damage-inducible protein DinB